MLDDTTAALNPCVIGDIEARLDTVIFHVCNFVPDVQIGEAGPHRLTFEHDRWIIELNEVSDARDRIREVRRRGGGTVTHVGTIRAQSGSSYAWVEVQDTLDGFGQFLNWAASDRVPAAQFICVRRGSSRHGGIQEDSSDDQGSVGSQHMIRVRCPRCGRTLRALGRIVSGELR